MKKTKEQNDAEWNGKQSSRPSQAGQSVGLSKREEIAMHFMSSLLRSKEWRSEELRDVAWDAIMLADVLLMELERRPPYEY